MLAPLAPITAASDVPPPPPDTRLHGHWLFLARSAWSLVAILTLVVFIVSLPVYWSQLQVVCGRPLCSPAQPTPAAAHSLQSLGLTLGTYASYQVALQVFVTVVSWSVAAVLFWRKSDDWLALLAGLFLITEYPSTQNGPLFALQAVAPAWNQAVNLVVFLGLLSLCFFFFLFPDGRFVPRWTCWLAIAAAAFNLPQSFVPGPPGTWSDVLSTVGFFGLVAAIIFAQSYRYWRVSTRVQRQQTKWIVLGIVIVILVGVIPPLIVPSLGRAGTLGNLLETSAFTLVIVLVPISIGISILRYRLWDIDNLINKALVYGLLTGLLGVLYAGLIIGLDNLAIVLTGETKQPIALVLSTLAIAALFQPVRHSLQRLIDRRFYRKKYDAEKMLAAFSATLQSEVDLEQIQKRLLAVVQETIQPVQVSLWLREPEPHSTEQAHHLQAHGQGATRPI